MGERGSAHAKAIRQRRIAIVATDAVQPHRTETAVNGTLKAAVEGEALADHDAGNPDELHQQAVLNVLGPFFQCVKHNINKNQALGSSEA